MIGVAMVGLGWWGRKMSTLIHDHSRTMRLVRMVEPNRDAAAGIAADLGVPLSTDIAEIWDDRAVDAVILATPHALHVAQIESAVAAGRQVFCEKPLALTRAEAARAVHLSRDAGLVLGMGHERRFEQPVATMLADAASGRLGTLLQVEGQFSHDKFLALDAGNWRLHPDHAPAAGMTATGIHLTDLAVKLLGPAADVLVTCEQRASKLRSGDTLSAYVRFAGGGTAYISASLAMPFVSRFAVYGTQGWVDIRDKAHVEAPAGWVVTRAKRDGPITVAEVGPAKPVLANLDAFARAVQGEAAYPITGQEMIANIALLEAIVSGAKSRRLETVAAI
jgi:predicted dehydrogenase